MDFNNGSKVSFFKILLNDSIDRLPLPPMFARKYLEKTNIKKQRVILKTTSRGVKWSVTYSKIKDEYYFMNGWLKFMKDNRLRREFFLVFWLLSPSPNLVFRVYIYSPSCCLVKHPTPRDDAGPSYQKTRFVEERTSDDDSFENVQQKMTKVIKKSYTSVMPMNNSFVKATGINGYDRVQLRNEEGKIWKVKMKKYESYDIIRLSTGWYDFKKHNKIKIGDTCEFYHVKSNLLNVRVLTGDEGA